MHVPGTPRESGQEAVMLKRTGPNMDIVEHFLRHGTMQEVTESQLTQLVTSYGITKVPRYQENRAAIKSKLTLENKFGGKHYFFTFMFWHAWCSTLLGKDHRH